MGHNQLNVKWSIIQKNISKIMLFGQKKLLQKKWLQLLKISIKWKHFEKPQLEITDNPEKVKELAEQNLRH